MPDNKRSEMRDSVKLFPDSPGVYLFFDKNGRILYVGKAKSLKKRVGSYFLDGVDRYKTRVLVSKIEKVDYIVVKTEADAFLLENNLIKQYQPHYNILLKDDKSFPWIVIKKEAFPRIFYTRNVIKDGSDYFGPYTSTLLVKSILDFVRSVFQLRNCKLNLSKPNIEKGQYKVCLEYHLGNCKAPCENKQEEEDYLRDIEQIKEIIKGNLANVRGYFETRMKEYAANLEFEQAERLKTKLAMLNQYYSKSTIVSAKIKDLDVFSINANKDKYYVNYLKVNNGAIIQVFNLEILTKLKETKEEVLLSAIMNIKERLHSNTMDVLVPFSLDTEAVPYRFSIPRIGDKKKLMDLSERNLKEYMFQKVSKTSETPQERKSAEILGIMKTDLRLQDLPVHIECFDNSNIQGTSAVSACVVFRNGKPFKKDYRHYHIKTVEGPNDFASMEEVLQRRYTRLLNEKEELPQLIVIDGGKGQLGMAHRMLQNLKLENKIAVVGIAKKLEEIYFPGDSYPLHIDKKSPSLKIIQHLRNEAHRFSITFHRNVRSKGMVESELDLIKGIGDKTKTTLLNKFHSIKGIREAKEEDLIDAIGQSKAQIIINYFKKQDEE